MDPSQIIKQVRKEMRSDRGISGDGQRIDQLGWLILLKMYDANEQESKLLDENYKPSIEESLLWSNWAANPEGITGDDLINFVDTQLFPKIKNLNVDIVRNPKAFILRQAFMEANNYMKSGVQLKKVINLIEKINFTTSNDRHLFGQIYEDILRQLQSAGTYGEFYTPRALTKFIVNRLDPEPTHKIIDPASGTGGFIVDIVEYLKEKNKIKNSSDYKKVQKNIYGTEKKQVPYILSIANMYLHGFSEPINIKRGNELNVPIRERGNENFDIVVANPPFGGSEETGVKSNFPKKYQSSETADMFMTLFIELLKDNGKAGVILPDSFLEGEDVKSRIKENLLKTCNLHTIVRLPKTVFAPYASAVKTNILFFSKGAPTKKIWYYEMKLPNGKNYTKTNPMKFDEFNNLINWWGVEENDFSDRKENDEAWLVDLNDIDSKYNLDFKNPSQKETITDFKSLYQELEIINKDLEKNLNKLYKYLGDNDKPK